MATQNAIVALASLRPAMTSTRTPWETGKGALDAGPAAQADVQEGREQGRIETLRRLLVLKFQRLGAEPEARLQAATPEQIDRHLQRLLTADSLAAVF